MTADFCFYSSLDADFETVSQATLDYLEGYDLVMTDADPDYINEGRITRNFSGLQSEVSYNRSDRSKGYTKRGTGHTTAAARRFNRSSRRAARRLCSIYL